MLRDRPKVLICGTGGDRAVLLSHPNPQLEWPNRVAGGSLRGPQSSKMGPVEIPENTEAGRPAFAGALMGRPAASRGDTGRGVFSPGICSEVGSGAATVSGASQGWVWSPPAFGEHLNTLTMPAGRGVLAWK